MDEEDENRLGWWSMSGVAFMEALKRAAAGEEPDFIYLEYYTNSQIERNNWDD